ncbi:hypothetical protein CS0771_54940 [Catellatospora sp. IY07-71]|nr:hypothetical protein CS0771_54940 [Catellatospora sp. IY07-71]
MERALARHTYVAALIANAVPYALFGIGEQTVRSNVAGVLNATTPPGGGHPAHRRPRRMPTRNPAPPARPSRFAVAYGEPCRRGQNPRPRSVGRRRTGWRRGCVAAASAVASCDTAWR